MRVEVLGAERRRRWGDQKKLDIVMSIGIGGATVTDVAQRYDVTRQQIYTWRRELKKKGLLLSSREAVFLPVDMGSEQIPSGVSDDADASSSMIELHLRCGRSLRFTSTLEDTVLARLIRTVEQA
ncbi:MULTISPECIES: IS66-like element accessory protein TnpA [Brucella]|uniref:Transposase IS3/IS911 family protein n=4 Tax=Brucella TaxID=234 RepID=A6WXB7_BRUA4|nr:MULTISPECIES: transposase [Brucella]ABS13621.1 transposase IS3/IS911 family protein [Brucella anthropi ATCC 49188]ABS15441.1 transposase IS3/IS911 family protein [Brucella anthropi ATCC 49188]ABS17373.1 transposase IS3/IS911 family protein [Brucella anthropi ATCC 49188]AIK43356.1 transposase family protein [Brucella anthropi]KAB2702057.1 transposase [Brucella lupini]